MASATAIVRKWGSSVAVVLPAALVKAEHIKEGDEVVIDVHPADDFSDLFGAWKGKGKKMDTQAWKDELRREEREAERRKWGDA
jgi:hypothetical protein